LAEQFAGEAIKIDPGRAAAYSLLALRRLRKSDRVCFPKMIHSLVSHVLLRQPDRSRSLNGDDESPCLMPRKNPAESVVNGFGPMSG
jgi:hypothetical protein